MARRNRVPESVSMETPKARKAEERRRREILERQRREDHPSVSARDPHSVRLSREHLEQLREEVTPTDAAGRAYAQSGNVVMAGLMGAVKAAETFGQATAAGQGGRGAPLKLPPHPGKNLGARGAAAGYLAEKKGTTVSQELTRHATKGKDLTEAGRYRAELREFQQMTRGKNPFTKRVLAEERADLEDKATIAQPFMERLDQLAEGGYKPGSKKAVMNVLREMVSVGFTPEEAVNNAVERIFHSGVRSRFGSRFRDMDKILDTHTDPIAGDTVGRLHVRELADSGSLAGGLLKHAAGRQQFGLRQSTKARRVEDYPTVRELLRNDLTKSILRHGDLPEHVFQWALEQDKPGVRLAIASRKDSIGADMRSRIAKDPSTSPYIARQIAEMDPNDSAVKQALMSHPNPEVRAKAAMFADVTKDDLRALMQSGVGTFELSRSIPWRLAGKNPELINAHMEFLADQLERNPGHTELHPSAASRIIASPYIRNNDLRVDLTKNGALKMPAQSLVRGMFDNPGTRAEDLASVLRKLDAEAYRRMTRDPGGLNELRFGYDSGADFVWNVLPLLNVREAWADKASVNPKASEAAIRNLHLMEGLAANGVDLAEMNDRWTEATLRSVGVNPGTAGHRFVLQRANSLGGALNDFEVYRDLNNFSMYAVPTSVKDTIKDGFSGAPPVGPGDNAEGFRVVYQMRPDAFHVGPDVVAYHRDAGTELSGMATPPELQGKLRQRASYAFLGDLSRLSGWNKLAIKTGKHRRSDAQFWAGHSDIGAFPSDLARRYALDTLTGNRWNFGEVKADRIVPYERLPEVIGKVIVTETWRGNRTPAVQGAIDRLRWHADKLGIPFSEARSDHNFRRPDLPTEMDLQRSSDFQMDAKGGDTRADAKDAKGGKAPKLSEEQRVARVNAGIAKHPGFSKGDIEDMRRSAAFIADPQNAIRGLLVEGTLKHDAERPVFYSKNSWEDGQEGFHGDRFSMAHTLDDGRVVVIPSIYADEDGATRLHTGRDALKHYEQTGEHFGIYDSMENAERASVWSHHAGNAGWLKRLEKQQDAMGGDAGAASGGQVSEPGGGTFVLSPSAGGGPRIVINPSTFRNEKDALCVAFNEAFRLVMEEMGFNPVAEPTEAQRRFFSDTAYRNDELQLRRTILARVCTFDTSVKDPTDEQLQEAVEFLTSVLEAGAPQNEWEQRSVMRIRDVIAQVSRRGVPARGPRDAAARPGSPGGRAPGRGTGGST